MDKFPYLIKAQARFQLLDTTQSPKIPGSFSSVFVWSASNTRRQNSWGDCLEIKFGGYIFFADLRLVGLQKNPWARYLEGDNISTKIGSGRVEIEIGEASPTFWKIEIEIGEASPTFKISEAIRGKSRPISTLPDF